MKPSTLATLALVAVSSWAVPSVADWSDARCDIYPKGSDQAGKMIARTFSQRQGSVTITCDDGVTHDLEPAGDAAGSSRSTSWPTA